MPELSESLRGVMRRWATGVTIVTSRFGDVQHGMTVNSFTSISLDPAYVTVTLANNTRTYSLVTLAGIFGVTILSDQQGALCDLFSGREPESGSRFTGLETFSLVTGAPLISGGLAYLDCRIVEHFRMPAATLFVGEVVAARSSEAVNTLIYFNRQYHSLS
jgi:flavin reductase (DIM6/NTAB) family NADH-FMN oxidoreductase RutF